MAVTTDAPSAVDLHPDRLEAYRRELTGYCYRMLGSAAEAEDAVQDTLLRAWQAAGRFEGRSSVRSWLYRIATNVCLDMLRGRRRRARPMDLGPAMPPEEASLARMLPEHSWVTPVADARVVPEDGDPAEIAVARETVRLAFVTALQHLPPRQRAALILCEVLKMPAAEAATTLGTSVPAVNSALQRARVTMADVSPETPAQAPSSVLLDQYVDAFERYDLSALVKLLHDDAVMTMPPFSMWLRGSADIVAFLREPGPRQCVGSVLVPVQGTVNGSHAWAQYKPAPSGGYLPWALQVHEASGGRFSRLTFFLDAERLYPEFGLPPRIG
jgi:RNA polymerase sigma-70 factor (ECF subfamily)